MADEAPAQETTEPVAPVAPAEDVVPAEVTEETSVAPGHEDVAETFDRDYVEKLRKESARYRTEAKTYKDVFDGFDDDTREAWMELSREVALDPRNGSARMLQIAQQILGEDEFNKLLKDPAPKPLTRAELEKEFQKREEMRLQQEAVRQVEREAEELGFKAGTAEQAELFWYAHNDTGGDLKAAAEKIQARKQAIIDEYLESKKADAESFPTPTSAGAPAADDPGENKDFTSARSRLLARLAGAPGQ